MKKILIGALVGGVLLFVWQTLSWTVFELHYSSTEYTPKQDSVLAYLNSQFSEDAQYFLPTVKKGSSGSERQLAMDSAEGKPWAIVAYHTKMNASMVGNILRGLAVNIVLMALFCWILSKMNAPSFGTVLLSSLLVGLIAFLNETYTVHIWYKTFDLMAFFTDAIAGWGLAGIWLGWWYTRK